MCLRTCSLCGTLSSALWQIQVRNSRRPALTREVVRQYREGKATYEHVSFAVNKLIGLIITTDAVIAVEIMATGI